MGPRRHSNLRLDSQSHQRLLIFNTLGQITDPDADRFQFVSHSWFDRVQAIGGRDQVQQPVGSENP
jgi:hypothetical protein